MELVAPRGLEHARGPDAATAARRRIAEVDDHVRAWVELAAGAAPDHADGPLAGVPVGVKDIVDVAGVPTRCGSATRADAAPAARDADVVRMLRGAGAVVVGKTVTTEYAFFDPGPTRNPWDTARSPGGSSSGSAAAVASGAVPLAVGTQTAGSVVRPASYCGVAGLAVAHGSLPTDGVAPLAPSLDTLGLFAATVADVAEARAALGGPAVTDAGTLRLAAWDGTEVGEVSPPMREAHATAVARLRDAGVEVEPWPVAMTHAAVDQRTIMAAEAATSVPDVPGLGPKLRELVAEGRAVPPGELAAARERAAATRAVVLEHLEGVDAVLAPGALGVAPSGLDHTGDPAMSRPWHVLGLPALAVPGARDADGLPLGLQLLGHPDHEDALLAAGRRLEQLM